MAVRLPATIHDPRTLCGTQLGGYVIGPRIGRGGMAELYLARRYHVDAHRLVALKLVLPHLKDEPEFLEMFQREARVVASLRHPNIVGVLDCGFADGEAYIAMEYVHGRDLRGVLQRACARGDRPMHAAIAICISLCEALHHAHEQRGADGRPLGLVHRDVSPGNVLVAFDGTVKLADFGIAKAFNHTHATGTGVIKGKLGYMSPEQCLAQPLDRRSDVFNVGILLYELTTGRRLFVADSDFSVLNQVVNGEFLRPSQVDPSYPAELEQLVMTALAVQPGQRFTTARAMAVALVTVARRLELDASAGPVATWMTRLFGEQNEPQLDDVPGPYVPVTEVMDARETLRVTAPVPRRPPRRFALAAAVPIAAIAIALGFGAAADTQRSAAAATVEIDAPLAPGARTTLQAAPGSRDEPRSLAASTVVPAVREVQSVSGEHETTKRTTTTRKRVSARRGERRRQAPARAPKTAGKEDPGTSAATDPWRNVLPPTMRGAK